MEEYLHENIPLSLAMGVKVEYASKERVVLSAPFSPNINHKKTVFGGSLHALATLSCWSLLHQNLPSCEIVIASSDIQYLYPVTKGFKAECRLPESAEWERFQLILKKRGKARIRLLASIVEEGRISVEYAGVFVAIFR